jgi:hypothetical protein
MKKPVVLKVVSVSALFPELKGAKCYQQGRGQGSSLRIATARAFGDMYKRMKGRKTFTRFSVEVAVGSVTKVNEPEAQ